MGFDRTIVRNDICTLSNNEKVLTAVADHGLEMKGIVRLTDVG
mgnify:CR=1 FL=1